MILFNNNKFIFFLFLLLILFNYCTRPVNIIKNEYRHLPSDYDSISIFSRPDTLQFELDENVYNQIKSFNIFTQNSTSYISFYDRRSQSVNIYSLTDQRHYKSIGLKELYNNHQLYKTSVFIKNWDSIFIINQFNISLYDSSGSRKFKIEFPKEPYNSAAEFDSNKLPIFIGNNLYALSRNRVDYRSINALRDWQVLYSFNLEKRSVQLHYHLPELYQTFLYGEYLLNYNYCYNNRGNFVFSFSADTILYETNLRDYNRSYFARSLNQQTPITPLNKQELKDPEMLKEFYIRDSYGSVFFDPFSKYYLRLVRHKLTLEEFHSKKRQRRTVLILNENFQIIGESVWPEDADFDSLFSTPDGKLYARTKLNNENKLYFVQFDYQTSNNNPISLANRLLHQK